MQDSDRSAPSTFLFWRSDTAAVVEGGYLDNMIEGGTSWKLLQSLVEGGKAITHEALDILGSPADPRILRSFLIANGVFPTWDDHVHAFETWIERRAQTIARADDRRAFIGFARWRHLRRARQALLTGAQRRSRRLTAIGLSAEALRGTASANSPRNFLLPSSQGSRDSAKQPPRGGMPPSRPATHETAQLSPDQVVKKETDPVAALLFQLRHGVSSCPTAKGLDTLHSNWFARFLGRISLSGEGSAHDRISPWFRAHISRCAAFGLGAAALVVGELGLAMS